MKPQKKVTIEVASSEMEAWLDYKKISQKKRDNNADSIDALVDAVVDGTLSFQEDHKILHKLKFPIEGESPVEELVYKPRVNMRTLHLHLQGVKGNDGDGRMTAYAAAVTSTPKDVITRLDTEDFSIAQSIAGFFL